MIHVTVDTGSGTPVYAQIMDQVRALIREGVLRPGAALPSVRQLATDLEVNPNTIARAYTLLEQEGVLRTIPRRGTFVAEEGAVSAARASRRRLEEAIERVLEEARHLNLGPEKVLGALRRRLDRGSTDPSSRGE